MRLHNFAATQFPIEQGRACNIGTVNLENVFGQIEPDGANILHGTVPPLWRSSNDHVLALDAVGAGRSTSLHPVAALLSAAPISRLRRARAQESGTILFFGFWSQAKSRSARLDPPELIGLRKIGGALVLRRPLSRLLPVRSRRSHISRRRSAAFGPRQRSVPSGFGRH
jgi:hypothetical protein